MVALPTSCGDDQDPWCERLATVVELDALADSISASDPGAASEEVDRFAEVAAEAPEAVRGDMTAVADALEQVVDVALTGSDADPDDLELRREAVNEQLGRVTSNVTAVTSYAESECGIRLD